MATSIPMAPQPVLQSAGQWQVVAEDVASAISAHLEFQMGRKVPVQLYMMRRDDTLFADAFLNAVTTRLVQKGHLVAVDARPDVTSIGIDVLTVKSNAPRLDSSLTPGPLTILAAGVGVASALSGGALPKFPWGITASALALGSDMWNNRPPETDTELILTVSIAREGFYTFRTSAVYYVNEADIWQYIGGGQVPVGGGSVNLNKVPQGVVRYDLAGKPYIMKN
ncbi:MULTISPECIES: hypothetical protein [unclassified Azospirillum]|uniref:hypothetical protein n=1 Tax=unclassified Azospirillum TaxID=2630922 RepID=UPI001177E3BE|nr:MULTISPECIES: hypothetical protein [unclassified Azospirillum]